MTEELKQTIEEELVKKPREVIEAVKNSHWEEISAQIAAKNNLTEEETNLLQAEIALLFVGAEMPYYFTENIENNLPTSKKQAEDIAKEVFEKIFKPMTESLNQKIKLNLPNKIINWQQNVNFILSGGNYVTFILRPAVKEIEEDRPGTLAKESKLDDLKNSFTI